MLCSRAGSGWQSVQIDLEGLRSLTSMVPPWPERLTVRLVTNQPDGSQYTPSIYQHVMTPRWTSRKLVEVDVEERVDLHAVRADVHQSHVESAGVVERGE